MGVIFFEDLIYAVSAGLFGATFFMLVDLQNALKRSGAAELRDTWTLRMIALRCAVGIGGATVLYFFFQTGLLGEGVWPDLKKATLEIVPNSARWAIFGGVEFRLPNRDLALLIVWSFLAGYTQSLVPSILGRTAERAK